MRAIKAFGRGVKGFVVGLIAIPKDIRRYLAIRRM